MSRLRRLCNSSEDMWLGGARSVLATICLLTAQAVGAAPDQPLSPTNIFTPASTPADSIFGLSLFVLFVTAVIFVIVFTLLLYAVVKFRKRRTDDGREPPQLYGSNEVEIAWTIIPILIVIVLFLASARVIADVQRPAPLNRILRDKNCGARFAIGIRKDYEVW